MTEETKTVMPIQPIVDGRFVKNSIVERLLDQGPFDMNDIAMWDVSEQERIQFAQLIGYSLSGFGELSYVDDETYDAAEAMSEAGYDEKKARYQALLGQINKAREGVRIAAVGLFKIHPDDLEH